MDNPTKFNIEQYSNAPLRLELRSAFNVAPDLLFSAVSDHRAIVNWVPLMKAVSMEHHASDGIKECGVGSVRHCTLHGMGGIDETIVWWNPPYGYAFRVAAKSKMMMPTEDHISVMLIEPDHNGGSILTWRHYFNWSGLVMRHLSSLMFPMMMRSAINNIHDEIGDKGKKVEHACSANTVCTIEANQKSCCK